MMGRRPALLTTPWACLILITILLITPKHAASIDLFKGQNPPLQMADASTGTVTAIDPSTQDRAASTCDDIMARSVVLANEDKAAAMAERDEALASARDARDRVAELETELQHLSDELTVAKAEAIKAIEAEKAAEEDAKKNVDEFIHRSKAETHEMVERIRKDAEDEIAEAKSDAARMMEEAEELAGKARKDAQEVVAAAKAEAEAQVEKVTNYAQEEIAAAKSAAEQAVADAKKLLAKTKKDAEDQIKVAKSDAELVMKGAEKRLEQAKKVFQEELAKAKMEYRQMKSDADALLKKQREEADANIAAAKKEAEMSVSMVRTESEKKIGTLTAKLRADQEKTKSECEATASGLESRLGQLKKEKKEQITKMEAEHEEVVEKLVEDANFAKRDLEKKMTKEKQAVQKRLKDKEEEYNVLADKHSEETRQSSEKIETFERREKKFKTLVEKLKEDIKTIETEREQTYFNLTNIQRDAVGSVQFIGEIFYDLGVYLYQRTATAIPRVTAPVVEKLTALYDEHLKETVDTQLMPICKEITSAYKKHVVPVYEKHGVPAKKKVSVMIGDGWAFAVENAKKSWGLSVDFTKSSATSLYNNIVKVYELALDCTLDFIEKHDKDKFVTDGFRAGIKKYRDAADDVVALHLQLCAFVIFFFSIPWIFDIIYLLLDVILEKLSEVVILPFRIFWFFCPLRFLFRKKGVAAEVEISHSDKEEVGGEEEEAPELLDEKTTNAPKPVNGRNGNERITRSKGKEQ